MAFEYCVQLTRIEQMTAEIENNTEVDLRIAHRSNGDSNGHHLGRTTGLIHVHYHMPIIYIDTCNLRAIQYTVIFASP